MLSTQIMGRLFKHPRIIEGYTLRYCFSFTMSYTFIWILLFALKTTFVVVSSVSFNDCGSEYNLIAVDIEGCDEVPCYLEHGKWYNVTSKFQANQPSFTLSSDVYFAIFGVEHFAFTTPTKPCEGLTSESCPVKAQNYYEYRAEVYAHPDLIATRGLLTWKLKNEFNVEVICFTVSIRIIPSDLRNHPRLTKFTKKQRRLNEYKKH